ncbi:MAG: hypothetical protein JEY97_04605 [Bacteroidales bacterium]|nr:hypothetical protein [Bacteroidales bacterium]
MEALKFNTKILENGMIKLPEITDLANREIEIIIVLKGEKMNNKQISASEFLKKWSGFLSDTDTDDSRIKYLNKKYE